MAAIGTSDVAITVDRTNKRLQVAGTNFFRQSLNLSVASHGASAANLVLVLYRDGIVMQTVDGMSDNDPASAALDTNVTTMGDVFTGKQSGEALKFGMRLWDKSSEECLARGDITILGNADLYTTDGESEPTVPEATTGGWVHLGDDWWNGSDHYRLNVTTNKLRKVWTEGTGDQFHEVYDDAVNEIAIPT